jgi:hypothetical protein
MDLTKEEKRLIEFLRKLKWGKCLVEVKNGVPVMVHATVQDVKLTD